MEQSRSSPKTGACGDSSEHRQQAAQPSVKDNALAWLGVARADQVTFHPLSRVWPQGADPAPEILSLLPQSYQTNPRAHILTLRMQEWQSLHPWSWTAERAGI